MTAGRVVATVLVVYVVIGVVWWALRPPSPGGEWTPLGLNWPAHAVRWTRSNLGDA